jgi:CHRD domain
MKMLVSRGALLLMAALMGIAMWAVRSEAAPMTFKVALVGAQETPPVTTAATGTADITYDPSTMVVTWNVTCSGLSGPATMAHFHGPAKPGAAAPPAIWLSEKGSTAPIEGSIKGQATLTAEQAQQFLAGDWYINVHTAANPKGEIRGQVMPPKS